MKQKNHEGVGSIKINPKENEKKKKQLIRNILVKKWPGLYLGKIMKMDVQCDF